MADKPKIIELIKSGKCTEHIEKRREYSKTILRHTKKEGLDEFLAKITGYENEEQHKLRKKFAVSNKFITGELLRPVDNIWNARGGSFDLTMTSESIKRNYLEKATSSWHGASIHEFIQEIWLECYIEDPNGLIYLVLDPDTEKYVPQYVSIFKIIDYKLKGKYPEYVLFEPEITVNTEGKKVYTYTYVDNEITTKFQKIDDVVMELPGETKNTLKYVPAIVVSNLVTKDETIRLSPIDLQLEMLDSFVRKNSVKEIFEFLHAYPKFWYYGESCTECNGTGKIQHDNPDVPWIKCPKCDGIGTAGSKVDVSDATRIRIPEGDEQKIADHPMGFEVPPVETWQEMRSELDWMFDWIFRSHWGTTIEKGNNETATGRFIDVQPVQNKLSKYTDAAEKIENELYDLLGKLDFPNTFKRASRMYGRRYIIETPDAALKRYQEGITTGLPSSLLDYLLEQYYSAEFVSDEQTYNRKIKLSRIEPYVHYDITTVIGWEVSDEVKAQKLLFDDWLSTIQVDDLDTKTVDQLKHELKTYSGTNKNIIRNGFTDRKPGFKLPEV